MKLIRNCLLIGALILPYSVYATSTLPTPEDVQGLINVCAAGRSVEAVGELNLSYKKFFSGDVNGGGTLSDLGGIIASIEDEKLKTEVYGLYLSCIMPFLSKIIPQSESSDEVDPELPYKSLLANSTKIDLIECKRSEKSITCELKFTQKNRDHELQIYLNQKSKIYDENGKRHTIGSLRIFEESYSNTMVRHLLIRDTPLKAFFTINNVEKDINKFVVFGFYVMVGDNGGHYNSDYLVAEFRDIKIK